MKNLFSEQRLIHFAASAGPEAGKNTPEPTVEAPVDTPDAAANSINNAVEGLDGATQKELANLGIKKEELRGKNMNSNQ